MKTEKFEVHGGSQDGREFEFIIPFRPLTFSMDGHERYCLRPDNQSFGLVAPDADLVIHKDERDVRFGVLDISEDGRVETTDAFTDAGACISTAEYIASKDAEIAQLRAEVAAAVAREREECERLQVALRKFATCSTCHGKGKYRKSCRYCGDSTHDHECDDDEIECFSCGGRGFPAAVFALIESRPTPGAAKEAKIMNDKRCPVCDGFGTIDQDIIDGLCAECGGTGAAKEV